MSGICPVFHLPAYNPEQADGAKKYRGQNHPLSLQDGDRHMTDLDGQKSLPASHRMSVAALYSPPATAGDVLRTSKSSAGEDFRHTQQSP